MGEVKKFSLKPSDAIKGTLIDDIDVTFERLRFEKWDYQGKVSNVVPALMVTMVDEEGGKYSQAYSAGDFKRIQIKTDGTGIDPIDEKSTGIHESTNAFQFLASLVNSGFPEDKIENDVSVFEGLKCHVKRIPQTKRSNLAGAKEDATILVVSKIHKLPWEKGAGKATTATKASTTSAPVSDDIAAKTEAAVLEIVMSANGNALDKKTMCQQLFEQLNNAKEKDKTKMVSLAFDDKFLSAEGHPWKYDGKALTM